MRIIKTTVITLTAVLLLSACGTPTPVVAEPVPVETVVETPAPVATETPAVVEELEPEVSEYSQVIDDVLYEATEKAPVRIGDDTPGEPPTFDGPVVNPETFIKNAEPGSKYIVMIGISIDSNSRGKYYWSVNGESRLGNRKGLSASDRHHGFSEKGYFNTPSEAIEDPFIVDGRELNRAEYHLYVQEGMQFVYQPE